MPASPALPASATPALPRDQPRRTRIVVCSGVDCAGLGSGAALLEIEELCAELTDESARPSVQSGVCTLQCANAPVVNVQPSLLPTRHHSKVDGPQRCAEVVADAAPTPNAAAARGLMLRRADGLRWSALRQHARRRCGTREQHGLARQLALALQAEASAAAHDPALRARAERRAARLARLSAGT